MAEQKKQSTLLSFEEILPEETKHNDAEDSGVQKDVKRNKSFERTKCGKRRTGVLS